MDSLRRAPAHGSTRRRLIKVATKAAAASVAPYCPVLTAKTLAMSDNPFSLGVASGYPTATGMVLWSMLRPGPADQRVELPNRPIKVLLEIADDEGFARIVRRQVAWAEPQWNHSIHAQVTGLRPNRWYWYRFVFDGHRSETGRTRTTPDLADNGTSLRFAVAACQHFEQGFYCAYRQMAHDDLDLILHLGDYIYEGGSGASAVRRTGLPGAVSLDQYRAMYAAYRGDQYLRRAHAMYPWVLTWDDHEVENDYAGELSAYLTRQQFLARRAAAYQAYYEFLPLPQSMRPDGLRMTIHTTLMFGRLARFHMLDGRQYRSTMRCDGSLRGGGMGTNPSDCANLMDPARSFLGPQQFKWLASRLPDPHVQWNLIGQPTVFAPTVLSRGDRQWLHTDSWDGFPVERERLLQVMAASNVINPVVFSGDVHVFYANSLHQNDRPDTRAVGSEFVCSGITSTPPSKRYVRMVKRQRESVRFASPDYRGYLRVDLTAARMRVDMMAVENAIRADSPVRPLASFVVENGHATPFAI